MRIVLLGAPGSGKRTQTKLIVEKYGIPAICTGELLKDAVTMTSELGLQVKAAMESGHSVTEEVVLELIHERLLLPDARQGFVLDGFPRNILQAITLDELMIEIGQPLELALLIDIETDALMERIVGRRTCKSCGVKYNIFINPTAVEGICDLCGGQLSHRADDNEETISSRLHIYDHLVSPLIKHYSKQHKLQQVDGFGEIEEVFSRIRQIVDTHEAPAAVVDLEPVVTSLEKTDLQLVPEEDPVKQLIPTGLEPPKKTPGTTIERAAKKRAKSIAKTSSAKKKPLKKAAGSQKLQAAKKVTQKKKTPTVKKAAVKKKVVANKKVASQKKSAAKKKKAVTKKTVVQKKSAKKKVVKRAIVQKKQPVAKKKAVKKKAATS